MPLPSPLVAILKAHKLVEPYQGELVFPNRTRRGVHEERTLEDVLHAALARVGLEPPRAVLS